LDGLGGACDSDEFEGSISPPTSVFIRPTDDLCDRTIHGIHGCVGRAGMNRVDCDAAGATSRARLRFESCDLLGTIRLRPGENDSLFAEYQLNPAILLQV
jgi:hypothetical protein